MGTKVVDLTPEAYRIAERTLCCFNCGERIFRGEYYRQVPAFSHGKRPKRVTVCLRPCEPQGEGR
jgi:hypothetical protein